VKDGGQGYKVHRSDIREISPNGARWLSRAGSKKEEHFEIEKKE